MSEHRQCVCHMAISHYHLATVQLIRNTVADWSMSEQFLNPKLCLLHTMLEA